MSLGPPYSQRVGGAYWYSSFALEATDMNELANTVTSIVLPWKSACFAGETLRSICLPTYITINWQMIRNKPKRALPAQL